MDIELDKLIGKCDKYRKLANTTNYFAFRQSDMDKYLYYRQKLKEYSIKNNIKIEIKYKTEKFVPMSDWAEELENYSHKN